VSQRRDANWRRTAIVLSRRVLIALALAALACFPRAATADDWPQWRGPDRSNVSAETGLLKEWPKDGPPLVWRVEGLGHGVASVAVAGGRLFTLGYRGDDEFAIALDVKDGKKVWEARLGPAVAENSLMRWLSQRTPTVDGERLYAFTASGELICLETANGRELWRKHYTQDFEGRRGVFGYCDYPLVDGERLLCTPGGAKATVVALDKKTGTTIWATALPGNSAASYGSATVAEIGGVRQYVNLLPSGLVGLATADGKLLWSYDRFNKTRTYHTYAPIVSDDCVFCASTSSGFALVKLTRAGDGFRAEEVYFRQQQLQPWLGSPVLVGRHVYLCGLGGTPLCVELATGNVAWGPERVGAGHACLTCADGHLYLRYADGRVVLAEATPTGYTQKGSFTIPRATRDPGWTFPVVAGGRLYLRDQDALLCYDVADRKPRGPRGPQPIFVPTPHDVVAKMLELARVTRDDIVYDLGCGDGRILVAAAKTYGCRAVGYEIDSECVKLARALAREERVEKLVRIEEENLFKADLSGATVVALYLLPTVNEKLVPQLEKMKPGSRIVSHAFAIRGVRPDKVVSVTSEEDGLERKLYLWTMPLKKEKPAP
jgi:outer membrane protein assembly factor BamB